MNKSVSLSRRSLLAAPWALAQASSQTTTSKTQTRRNSSNVPAALYESIAAFWEPHERAILSSLDIGKTARLLDAGCGRGDHVLLFAAMLGEGGSVTGFDLRQESLDFAAARVRDKGWEKRVRLEQGDLFAMPYEPASFDVVWSSHVFHGLRKLPEAARAIRRVVKPGGRFVLRENRVNTTLLPTDIGLGEPGLESRLNFAFDRWLQRDRMSLGRYPHGWLHLLRSAGFAQVTARSFVHEVTSPLDERQTAYLSYWLDRKQDIEGISADDKKTLRALVDPDSEHYFLRRDDLHFVSVSTTYSGVAA